MHISSIISRSFVEGLTISSSLLLRPFLKPPLSNTCQQHWGKYDTVGSKVRIRSLHLRLSNGSLAQAVNQYSSTMSLLTSDAVSVGEYSLSIIAIIILWIAFQVSLRRWNDLLRLPILWLKWAIPLFFLYGQTRHMQ